MIRAVLCDQPSFKPVTFEPGFNIVLADQTQKSTSRDTRNGAGKSLLVEIIHFCLGSTGTALKAEAIKGWTFTVVLELEGQQITVSRNTARDKVVVLEGDFSEWAQRPVLNSKTGQLEMSINNWIAQLGALTFDLEPLPNPPPYMPGFRNLFSYFVRRGREAFASAFENHKSTSEGEKQIYNAFLLGLNWDFARQFQIIKDKRLVLNTLRKAAKSGLIEGYIGTIGDLQAAKVRLEDEAATTRANLDSFRVHPQYEEIEHQANLYTREIHTLNNQNIADRDVLTLYETTMNIETEPPLSDVEMVYRDAGILFPEMVRKRFDEVESFHKQLTDNRKQFIGAETDRLRRAIAERNDQIRERTIRRAEYMTILQTYGALSEYTHLQQLHLEKQSRIADIAARIQNLRSFEEGMSSLKIEQENLLQATRRDLNERESARREAIRLFNANSNMLYDAPGRLAIDVKDTGYDFKVEIERSGSEGINSMKIFCYDLMLAQLWSEKPISPRILVHDSTLFDGVDERQKANALILAEREARERNFQYICLLNSDSLPKSDLMNGFDLDAFVRICLTDQVDGCLLGIRY